MRAVIMCGAKFCDTRQDESGFQTRKTSVLWDKSANSGAPLTQVHPLRCQLCFSYQVNNFSTPFTVVPLLCGTKLCVPLWQLWQQQKRDDKEIAQRCTQSLWIRCGEMTVARLKHIHSTLQPLCLRQRLPLDNRPFIPSQFNWLAWHQSQPGRKVGQVQGGVDSSTCKDALQPLQLGTKAWAVTMVSWCFCIW